MGAAAVFASKGATVVMACRSERKASAAIAGMESRGIRRTRLVFMPLDLSNLSSVAEFAATFLKTYRKLDALVCNAGIMAPERVERTAQGFESQFGVNMLGHYALITLLLPRLLGSPTPTRITIVTSGAHWFVPSVDVSNLDCSKYYNKWIRYCETKLGDMLMVTHIGQQLAARGITKVTVTAAHPGYAATNLQDGTMFSYSNFVAQSSEHGALPTVMATVDQTLKSGELIGPAFFAMGAPTRAIVSPHAKNVTSAKEVCQHMEGLLGYKLFSRITPIKAQRLVEA